MVYCTLGHVFKSWCDYPMHGISSDDDELSVRVVYIYPLLTSDKLAVRGWFGRMDSTLPLVLRKIKGTVIRGCHMGPHILDPPILDLSG